MQTLHIELPDALTVNLQKVQLLLTGKLYEQGFLSAGQAAKMAGISKQAFMELLGRITFPC